MIYGRKATLVATVAAAFAASAVVGCSKKGDDAGGSGTTSASLARDLFDRQCSTCHGDSGRGDGPAARALNVKPRNYTDAAWQKSVTDAQIRAVIVGGGSSVGKSASMPANPQLEGQPAVLDALVAIVRAFGASD